VELRDVVGEFFEKLAAKILKGRPVNNGTLDLGICKALVGVEVKGNNNSNRFRISVQQFQDHLKSNLYLFPDMLEELLYCLFCYQNPRKPAENGDGLQTALSSCKDPGQVFAVLAQNTDMVFLLDYRIIVAIKELLGTMTGQFLCEREIEVVPIGKNYLKGFTATGAKERLLSLNLNPEEWIVRERFMHVCICLDHFKHKLKLRIVEVFPQELMLLLDKVLKVPLTRPSRRTLVLKTESEPYT